MAGLSPSQFKVKGKLSVAQKCRKLLSRPQVKVLGNYLYSCAQVKIRKAHYFKMIDAYKNRRLPCPTLSDKPADGRPQKLNCTKQRTANIAILLNMPILLNCNVALLFTKATKKFRTTYCRLNYNRRFYLRFTSIFLNKFSFQIEGRNLKTK